MILLALFNSHHDRLSSLMKQDGFLCFEQVNSRMVTQSIVRTLGFFNWQGLDSLDLLEASLRVVDELTCSFANFVPDFGLK